MGVEALTVHFHGMHQTCNTWMDGVPYVSQCPVQPGNSFTYRFTADPAGTHWYHSHQSSQRMDGFFGSLIVHDVAPQHTYYPVNVIDWWHPTAGVMRMDDADHPVYGPGQFYHTVSLRRTATDNTRINRVDHFSTLVNGRGRTQKNPKPFPYEEFIVTRGERTRFYLTHSGAEYPYEVSVDEHMISVVCLESGPIKPVPTDSFIIMAGQSIEFELSATKKYGRYWMRFTSLGDSVGPDTPPDGIVHEGKAIVKYDNAIIDKNPKSKQKKCSSENPCVVFNCALANYPANLHKRCLHLSDVESALSQEYLDEHFGLNCEPDEEHFLNFAFHEGSSINSIAYANRPVPFSQDVDDAMVPCDEDECATGCRCTKILKVPRGKVIQLVYTNYKTLHHPVHLHGFSTAVLKQGFSTLDNTTGRPVLENPDVACNHEKCYKTSWSGDRPEVNTVLPPVRNTVMVPALGYVVLRFRSDNPGYWFLHCHFPFHVERGMAIVLQVGEKDEINAPPNGFPTCGNFAFEDDYDDYIEGGQCEEPSGDCEDK